MSDVLKNAFNYWGGANVQISDNSYVGQTVTVSGKKLKIKKVVAEGE